MPFDAANPVASAPPQNRAGDFWSIYDALSADLDPAVRIEGFAAGLHWFGVRAGGSVGFAMSPREGPDSPSRAGRVAGAPLDEIARLARSWNFADAALGVAALNAYHNQSARLRDWLERSGEVAHGANAFAHFRPRLAGKRVAVVGHFRGLKRLGETCELTILERRPQPGDVPDPACEVVLPQCDYVFITATTLINKTLPRLLALSRGAFVVLVGPTTPLTPVWFDLGVHAIAGLSVDDVPGIWRIVQEGGKHEIFEHGGRLVLIERS
jgi:uncharacterized protein